MMTCHELREQLELMSLQAPDMHLPEDVRNHLEACPDCSRELYETREAWALLAVVEEPLAPSDKTERALFERIASGNGVTRSRATFVVAARYVLAASVLIAMTAGALLIPSFMRDDGEFRRQLAGVRDLAEQMDKLEQLERAFASPKLRLVSLRSSRSSRVQGFMAYDLTAGEGHFFGFDLPTDSGGTAVFWLLAPAGAVLARAPIDVHEDGLGAAIVALPDDLSALHDAAITLEASADATEPSGDIVMRTRLRS